MRYATLIDTHGDSLVAEFPDCPGCQASGDTREAVVAAARTALHRWLESCLVEDTSPPRPSVAVVSRDWFEWVDVDPDLARRMLLRWAVARRISRGELARRAGLSEDDVARLQDPAVKPTPALLDGVARALGVVGGSARVPVPSETAPRPRPTAGKAVAGAPGSRKRGRGPR
jgi:predicted RNase H-like HicB family nuclease/DNA-binding Xre family transcriptional regulator